jgi:hypothetical protein
LLDARIGRGRIGTMSQHDESDEPDRDSGKTDGQDSLGAASESKESCDVAPLRATELLPKATAGNLTVEVLDRYLAAAAEDREAAEERSAEIISRFSKLTIAMMCVTMVIAGANVAMIIRQSSAPQPRWAAIQPPAVTLPRPAEMPMLVVPQAPPVLPAPAPLESREPPRPAEKIPLFGSPPSPRARQVFVPGPPRLARTTPPRPQPLLSDRSIETDSRESTSVERW